MKFSNILPALALAALLVAGLATNSAEASQVPDADGLTATHSDAALAMPTLAAMLEDKPGLTEGEEAKKVAQRRRGRRGRGRRGRGRRGFGRGVGTGLAIGLGAAILSGALSQQRARASESQIEEAMYRCDAEYRSFNWDTGTVVTYNRGEVICPYLRPYFD